MKNFREYYMQCFEAEKPTFIRVMKAIPPGQESYRPHPRSTSAGDLVWLLAVELHDACELVDHGEVNYVPTPAPTVPESITAYEKNAAELEKRLALLDDRAWERKVRLLMDGKSVWETTLGDMLFGFLFDAVHHRGQLSVYLRLLDVPIPSIYGPTADEPWGS